MSPDLDIAIIGAGVIGAAIAYALHDTGREVYVLESEPSFGRGISSRNSGVIHAGLYYPPDSLKTRLCIRGKKLLYCFAQEKGVPIQRVGKYIVANSSEQQEHLSWLLDNRPAEVTLYETEQIPAGICAKRALFSPSTGIVDIHRFIGALLDESKATVLYNQTVTNITLAGRELELELAGERYKARQVINCAGLTATGFCAGYRHYFGRGNYFQVTLPHGIELPHLVYPAVGPNSPGLGIHLTRDMSGQALLGPDFQWQEHISYAVDETRLEAFYQSARTYLPWLERNLLSPAYTGIRPKLSLHQNTDFTFVRQGGGQLIHCLGIESPGITASMAIAEFIVDQLPQ